MNRSLKNDDELIDELGKWADTPKHFKFLRELREYFDVVSMVLIVRAIEKSKLLEQKTKQPTRKRK